VPLGTEKDASFLEPHSDLIIESVKKKPGVLIAGPGIGTTKEAFSCLYRVLQKTNCNTVLDADGLAGFDSLRKLPEENRKNWLLTPHTGEMKRYLKLDVQDDFSRLREIETLSAKYGCSILSKGNPVIFTNNEKKTFITGYDTSLFSRAGFGDVLCGTIAAYWGINNELTVSTIQALLSGYKKYHQLPDGETFGPEHLL
jgi:NAD(P)H-hydrate epimerase